MSKVVLNLWGTSFLMESEDAFKVFEIMKNVPQFYEYNEKVLTYPSGGRISITVENDKVMDEIAAAKALNISLYQYRKDSGDG